MKSFLLIVFTASISVGIRAQSLDYKIIKECNIETDMRHLDNTFRFFSDQNKTFIVGLPAVLLADGFIKKDKDLIRAGENAFISLGASTFVTWGLKYSIHRHRPFEKYPEVLKLSNGGGSSFPSGHTSAAFAVATSVSMCYHKWYVIAPCYLWASAVGFSRVALGVHYPSDVLAGALVGIGAAYITNKANHWLKKNKNRKPGSDIKLVS